MDKDTAHQLMSSAAIVMVGVAEIYHIKVDAALAVAAVTLMAPVVKYVAELITAKFPVPAPKAAPAPEAPKAA